MREMGRHWMPSKDHLPLPHHWQLQAQLSFTTPDPAEANPFLSLEPTAPPRIMSPTCIVLWKRFQEGTAQKGWDDHSMQGVPSGMGLVVLKGNVAWLAWRRQFDKEASSTKLRGAMNHPKDFLLQAVKCHLPQSDQETLSKENRQMLPGGS